MQLDDTTICASSTAGVNQTRYSAIKQCWTTTRLGLGLCQFSLLVVNLFDDHFVLSHTEAYCTLLILSIELD